LYFPLSGNWKLVTGKLVTGNRKLVTGNY